MDVSRQNIYQITIDSVRSANRMARSEGQHGLYRETQPMLHNTNNGTTGPHDAMLNAALSPRLSNTPSGAPWHRSWRRTMRQKFCNLNVKAEMLVEYEPKVSISP